MSGGWRDGPTVGGQGSTIDAAGGLMMAHWVRVARLGDIPEGGGRSFELGGRTIGVYRCGTRTFAIGDVCTHAFALLHEGSVDRVRCTVECPLHGAEFDLATGAVLSPPAPEAVPVYPVRIAGDDLEVELPDET